MSELPGESRPAGHLSSRWKKAAPRRGRSEAAGERRGREGEQASHSDPLPATASVLKYGPSPAATDFSREIGKCLRDAPGALVCFDSLKRAETGALLESFRAAGPGLRAQPGTPSAGPKGPGKRQRGPLSSEAEGPRRPRRRSPALTSPELEDARRPRDAPDPPACPPSEPWSSNAPPKGRSQSGFHVSPLRGPKRLAATGGREALSAAEPPSPLRTWLGAETGDVVKATGKPETQREAGGSSPEDLPLRRARGKGHQLEGTPPPAPAPHQRGG